jgi:hypothetical protein
MAARDGGNVENVEINTDIENVLGFDVFGNEVWPKTRIQSQPMEK